MCCVFIGKQSSPGPAGLRPWAHRPTFYPVWGTAMGPPSQNTDIISYYQHLFSKKRHFLQETKEMSRTHPGTKRTLL